VRTLGLIALVLGLLVVTAVAAPWVAAGLAALGFEFKFSRVWNRVFEVLLVVGVGLLWRRLDLGRAADLGLVRAGWARDLGIGLAVGLAGMLTGLLVCWLGGGLVPQVRFPEPWKTVRKALSGFAAAALVGGGEEVLFRGVLLRRLMADCGRAAGVVLVTALYGVVHALRPGGSREAHASAGLDRLLTLFAPLGDPGVLPAIAGLAALGAVLAFARLRTASLWIPVGIHAAVVAVFRVGRLFFHVRPKPAWLVGPGWPPLIGGVAGGVAVATMLALLVVVLQRRRRATGAPLACPG